MPCCWKVSSLKACPWKRRLNCNPHLIHLSPVSGSIFLWINAPSSAMLCSSAVSRIWHGHFTGRKWDSLTWLPSPSGPLLFPDSVHLLHLLDGLASSRGSSFMALALVQGPTAVSSPGGTTPPVPTQPCLPGASLVHTSSLRPEKWLREKGSLNKRSFFLFFFSSPSTAWPSVKVTWNK